MSGDKKAAVELSISTIVIVVLAMSMLILGLVLVRSIFTGATSIADMTNTQVKNQIAKLFAEDQKLVIYPDSRQITIKQGATPDGFGIGIKNLMQGSTTAVKFSYEVVVSDPDLQKKCGVGEKEAEGWIVTGRSEDNMQIASGDFISPKVLLSVPVGAPLCTLRYRVNVKANGQAYASDLMDITIAAK